jgi:F0F1-type ATP synthase assembly protein I
VASDFKPESGKGIAGVARQLAMAMELPFVLLGCVFAGGLIGYGVDHWLHTQPFGLLIGGALGFAAGIRDLLRRISKEAH